MKRLYIFDIIFAIWLIGSVIAAFIFWGIGTGMLVLIINLTLLLVAHSQNKGLEKAVYQKQSKESRPQDTDLHGDEYISRSNGDYLNKHYKL